MDIKITSQYLNKEQMVVVEDFVNYCVKRFHLNKSNCRIKVSICQRIEYSDEGNCVFDDEHDYCKEVKIKIRYNKNMKRVLTALSHEMIHAKQYITGQLDFVGNKAHWRGANVSTLEYRSQPHEVEAFELEGVVLEDFYKSRKHKIHIKQ